MVENLEALARQMNNMSPFKKTSWGENRPQNDAKYYGIIKEKYELYTRGNELLTVFEAIDAMKKRTISLLTNDVGN